MHTTTSPVTSAQPVGQTYAQFAALSVDGVFQTLQTAEHGLAEHEAKVRLVTYGPNELARKHKRSVALQLLLKFANPLVVVLLLIAAVSFLFSDVVSGIIIFTMAVISVLLSFTQEYRAGKEAEKLSEMVRARATVVRCGHAKEIHLRDIVPGDILELQAGDMIPADARVIASKDLFINQASLTGESLPVEKFTDAAKTDTSNFDLPNILFMGTSVESGTAHAVVVRTGIHTEFGEISKNLAESIAPTSFDRGISRLTWLMIRFMLALVIVIFGVNAAVKGDFLQALLFSLAVAVGLTPEMLPMVLAMNLSKGAIAMAKKKVIVKHLNSIEDLGAMDILCTDKTGTLTLDRIVLERYCDVAGTSDESVLLLAYVNSYYQTGLKGLLDSTILHHKKEEMHGFKKVDEIPFDFDRKIMSVVVDAKGTHRLIAKGAPEEIFKRCTKYEVEGKTHAITPHRLEELRKEYDSLSAEGFRVLAVAFKDCPVSHAAFGREDECDLILKGYLAFLDPPKPTAKETVDSLRQLGVAVKVLTGDNALVTRKICGDVGIDVQDMLTGDQIEPMPDEQLRRAAQTTTVFSRLTPLQKERIIRMLRADGHTVGYMGDGINDAPALKAADVGISVQNAVDIAKESADFILLQKNLVVLKDGIIEGRKTFCNILKYIRMGTSSNFGNMLSMTAASIFLPFLPMLPIQILVNNFLYDLSQLAIPTDEVDEDAVAQPHSWDLRSIQRFMLLFGPLSSIFDFITIGVLLLVFKASVPELQTGWFIESLITQTLVIHIIRTRKLPFLESRPSTLLLVSTGLLTFIGVMLPFTALAAPLGFVVLPPYYFVAIFGVSLTYFCAAEITKDRFVRRFGFV